MTDAEKRMWCCLYVTVCSSMLQGQIGCAKGSIDNLEALKASSTGLERNASLEGVKLSKQYE